MAPGAEHALGAGSTGAIAIGLGRVGEGVGFSAIAGGEDHAFVELLPEALSRLREKFSGKRGTLSNRNGSGVMVQACYKNLYYEPGACAPKLNTNEGCSGREARRASRP